MKRILILLVVAAAAYGIYYFMFRKDEKTGPHTKETAILLKKHSPAFNAQVDNIVNNYLAIKDAFVTADTATAKETTRKFITSLDSLNMDGYKIKIGRVQKCGIDACDFDVILDHHHQQHKHSRA